MLILFGMHRTEPEEYLTRKEVESLLKVSRTTLYEWMKCGLFPRPIRVGLKAVRWPRRDIDAWFASRPQSTGDREATEAQA